MTVDHPEAQKDLVAEAEKHISAGWDAEEQGDATAAEAFYIRAAEVAPEYWRCHYRLGTLYATNDRPAEAERSLQQSVRLDPVHPEVHHAFGWILMRRKEFKSAIGAFQFAVRLVHEDSAIGKIVLPGYFMGLGFAYTQDGQPDHAADAFRHVLRLEPTDYNAFRQLAELLVISSHDACELEDLACDFIEIEPERREAWGYLAAVMNTRRRPQVARAICKKTAERFPDWGYIHLIEGHALMRLRNSDDAEAAYKRALELDPGLLRAHSALGDLFYGDGRIFEAARQYFAALKIDGHHVDAHAGIGLALLYYRRFDEAEAALMRAIAYDPSATAALVGLGLSRLHNDDAFAALFYLSRAIEVQDSLSVAHAALGDAYVAIRAYDRAEAAYLEALKHNPLDAYSCGKMADLLAKCGRPDEAAAYRKRTMGFEAHPILRMAEDIDAGLKEIADIVRDYLDLARIIHEGRR